MVSLLSEDKSETKGKNCLSEFVQKEKDQNHKGKAMVQQGGDQQTMKKGQGNQAENRSKDFGIASQNILKMPHISLTGKTEKLTIGERVLHNWVSGQERQPQVREYVGECKRRPGLKGK